MKSPIFGKEKLLYFPQKSGIVPIFSKRPSSYISYFCEYTPCFNIFYYKTIAGCMATKITYIGTWTCSKYRNKA